MYAPPPPSPSRRPPPSTCFHMHLRLPHLRGVALPPALRLEFNQPRLSFWQRLLRLCVRACVHACVHACGCTRGRRCGVGAVPRCMAPARGQAAQRSATLRRQSQLGGRRRSKLLAVPSTSSPRPLPSSPAIHGTRAFLCVHCIFEMSSSRHARMYVCELRCVCILFQRNFHTYTRMHRLQFS